MTNTDFGYYRDQLGESGKRCHWALYILLVTSILLFSIDWNSDDSGWLYQRIILRHKVLGYLNALKNKASKPEAVGLYKEELPKIQKAIQDIALEEDIHLTDAAKYGQDPDANLKKIADETGRMEDQWFKQINYFKLPLMDVQFDLNDLGFMGSVEQFVLEAIFCFCLMSHRRNLEMIFKKIGTEKKSRAEHYDQIAMQQLFTLPPGHRRGWISWVPRFLFLFPFFAQLKIVGGDLSTLDIGANISSPETVFVTASECVFSLLVIFSAVASVVILNQMDNLWEKNTPAQKKPGPKAA
jgi:hypothetical protein